MNPASKIIQKFGGAAKVAALLECDESTVHRWTYPRERGGTDGFIPRKPASRLLECAHTQGIELRASDFFDQSEAA